VVSTNTSNHYVALKLFTVKRFACANMDQRIIPFRLRPASDCYTSTIFPPPRSPRRLQRRTSAPIPPPLCHQRKTSAPITLPVCPNNLNRQKVPVNLNRIPRKPVLPAKHPDRISPKQKPYSMAPRASYSKEEWASAVQEVKKLHSDRHHRLCAKKCIDILENPRGPVSTFLHLLAPPPQVHLFRQSWLRTYSSFQKSFWNDYFPYEMAFLYLPTLHFTKYTT